MARRNGTNPGRPDPQTPERVQNAARAAGRNTSSGLYRGYVPQNTGGYNPNSAQNTGRQPDYAPYPQPYAAQGNAPTGGMNYTNPMNGGQRGHTTAPAGNGKRLPQKKNRHAAAIVIAIVLLIGIGFGAYYLVQKVQDDNYRRQLRAAVEPYDSLFCPGVYVDGIDLGGMTTEQAWNSVQSRIQQRKDSWQVLLVYEGNVVSTINASMLGGMDVDPAGVLNEAWLQGHSGTDAERLQAMQALQQNPYQGYTAQPAGDTSVIDSLMAQIKTAIDTPPQDAAMTGFNPDADEPFTFRDEVYGRSLNTQPLIEQLYRMVSTMESGTVEIVPDLTEPNVKKADILPQYSLRASAYTPIDKHSPDNRNNNIRHAFEFVNGYRVDPGKSFSFNGVVGERTAKNGFLTAIEYAYGEHVEGTGGGVCQASTTIYQAAVAAGLQIVKREPHSDSVSYTDYGKDATVYWSGKRKIDFVFKNNTDYPIYMTAHVEKDPTNKNRLICKVCLYGMDLGNVRYELAAEITDVLPAPIEPKYVKDTNGEYVTYKDQQKSVSKAKEGYIVKSYRLEYTDGVLTNRVELDTDRYEPQPEKIYVGVQNR